MKLIIHRYIFGNLLVPFLLSMLVFTFTFFIYRVFQLTEMVVNRGMTLADVLKVFLYASPYFFMFTIPMAVLFSVVITYVRLSADNEITALKAAGVSLYRMLPPVATLTLIGCALTLFTSVYLTPRGNTAMADLIFKMTSTRADVVLRERIFIDDFEGLVLYVDSIDSRTRRLKRVFVHDDRDREVDAAITADYGLLLRDPVRRLVVLRLFDGMIDRLARDWSQTQTIRFATYDLMINVRELAAARQAGPRHRSEYKMGELKKLMDEAPDRRAYTTFATIYHERLAIPFSCLALGFLAVPLALQARGSTKATSGGVILGVLSFVAYYLLYSLVRGLGDKEIMPTWLALWTPNLVFAGLAVHLMRRAARERAWTILEWVSSLRLPGRKRRS